MLLSQQFRDQYGAEPTFSVRSPGRVNLIGEHVDYNDGLVLPMAIPLQTEMALRPRDDDKIVLYSPLFQESREFTLSNLSKQGHWIDYVQAVASVFQDVNIPMRGFEGVVMSNLPLASGLSSSASIEVAVALAFLQGAQIEKSPSEIALLCQRAENEFIGVKSGIMDQMAVAACTADHALLLDCRDLSMRQVPFKLRDYALVVTDSAAPRELASSAYNERRAQCEEGLRIMQRKVPDAQSLRDISHEQLDELGGGMSSVVRRRLEHVIGEIERVQIAVAALERGDLETFGQQMNMSHASLRDDYEVSSKELDFLTDWARRQPGVLGSRMTGAGFGGCTVTLIEKSRANAFIRGQIHAYGEATNRQAHAWICEASAGAQVLD